MITMVRHAKFRALAAFLSMLILSGMGSSLSAAEEPVQQESQTQVIQSFNSQEKPESELVALSDQDKQIVMFAMGVPLLVLLLATGGLGIALGIYGKPVFVAHMVCAGLSVTLAIAHAIVGIVWFYPF